MKRDKKPMPPDDDPGWQEIPPWDLPEIEYDAENDRIVSKSAGKVDFENNRIIGKSGRVYENVQINLDDLRRCLKDSRH